MPKEPRVSESASPSAAMKSESQICQKPEWEQVNFGGDFRADFSILDNHILISRPSGYATPEDVRNALELNHKVIRTGIPENTPYVQIEDYSNLSGAALTARKYFIHELSERRNMLALIFSSTSPMMKLGIRFRKYIHPFPFKVCLAEDLTEAIQTAAALLAEQNIKVEPDQKYMNEILEILAGIRWEAQTPESILEKVDARHPFRKIAEAISLIKMDIDHLLAEKEASEKILLENNERHKAILDNIEDGYYEANLKGNFTFFNPSLCSILGYSKGEMMGMNFRRFSAKEDVRRIYTMFNQVYRTGESTKALDWKLTRKDGAQRFIEVSIALIKNKDGLASGFRGIVRDITHRIETEQEKLKLADRLRQAQKMEAMGTLAGGVAHDLNNILSGIVSYPDLLLMKIPPASPLRKPLETIKKSEERAAAIVQDLLTLARRGITNQVIVNLNAIIIDYLKSPEHNNLLIYHPLVEVDTRLDKSLHNISASPIHIIKILMNLISNAAEAMPDGGVIDISTENVYLDAPFPGYSGFKEGDFVKLQVKDSGIGISAEDKDRIFEPFYTKKVMGRSGSGLGMALVWGAVQDHNGYIDLQSALGKGTRISIYFPADRSEPPVIQTEFSIDRFKSKGESVLVVDDLQDQRELAAELLIQLGYVVHTAPSGEAAIEYLKKNKADLMVLDMIMQPGIDGLDTFKEVLKIKPSQKAVIATGFSTSERILTAQSLGAGACLKKPYLLEDMARIVREELDR